MKYHHETSKRTKVTEPVQVYLDVSDRRRLERLTQRLETTKSGVLREALAALERQLMDVAHHPALQIIGIAPGVEARKPAYDVALEHDRYLADLEEQRVKRPSTRRRRGT